MTNGSKVRFSLLHTNDLHSCFEGLGPDAYFSPNPDDRDPIRGHYARLATAIHTARAERENRGETVFLVDAGDAEFGALFHLLGPRPDHPEMPEYRFFHDLRYDVLGIGNHFFEAGPDGLQQAWKKVEQRPLVLPFLLSNAVFTDPNGLVVRHFHSTLQPPRTTGFHRLMVRDLPGNGRSIRIGWLGLLGPYGAKVSLANRSDLHFIGFNDETGKEEPEPLFALTRQLVTELRETHHADVVVALFHGGHPEDQALARAVPGLDVIIAGHTHGCYAETVGGTVIAQAGYAGTGLGCLDFSLEGNVLRWENPAAPLIPITSSLAADPPVLAQIEGYKRDINALLADTPFAYDTPVFHLDHDLPRRRFPDNAAGTFVTSGILQQINQRITPPVDVFFSSFGLVRSEFLSVNGSRTTFQYSDVFRFFPLGFGRDFKAGTPVHTFYLTRADLKSLLEAMAAVSMTSAVFEPVVSDTLTFKISWWGIPFYNKVHALKLHGRNFVADDHLIHVATDEYFSRNLRRIKVLSMGFSQAIPRDAHGRELTVFPDSPLPPEHDLLAFFLRDLSESSGRDGPNSRAGGHSAR